MIVLYQSKEKNMSEKDERQNQQNESDAKEQDVDIKQAIMEIKDYAEGIEWHAKLTKIFCGITMLGVVLSTILWIIYFFVA